MADLTTTERDFVDRMCPASQEVGIGTRIYTLEQFATALGSVATGAGASTVAVEDAAGRWAATNLEALTAEAAGSGRTVDDTIRSGRLANVDTITATSDILLNHLAVRTAGGSIQESTGAATETVLGVNNRALQTVTTITAAGSGDIVVGGEGTVTAGPQNIAILARLAANPGGTVGTWQDAATMLMNVVASVATDDFTAGTLAGHETVEVRSSADGNDEGLVVTLHGWNASGVYITEDVTLDLAQATIWTASALTYEGLAAIEVPVGFTDTLQIRSGTGHVSIMTAAAATGWYGRVLTDVSDDALGRAVEIMASAAATNNVIIIGTDGAGTAIGDVVTLTGTTWARSALAFNTVTAVYCAEDNVATLAYSIRVPADHAGAAVGIARMAITHDATGSAQICPDAARWASLLHELSSSLEVSEMPVTATSALRDHRIVVRTAGGNIQESSGVSTEAVLGANVSGATIAAGAVGRIQTSGYAAEIMAGPQSIAALARLAAGPGGVVLTWQDNATSLMSAVVSLGTDDFTIMGAADTVQIYEAIDVPADQGKAITIIGWNASGVMISEDLVLANPSNTVVVSANTYTQVAAINVQAALAQNLTVERTTGPANITTIAAGGAAWYGRVTPDDSTDALGHAVEVWCAAACAGQVLVIGTNGAGAAQSELITMNGATKVRTTQAWNSVTFLYVGADNQATATYNIQVPEDDNAFGVGIAKAAITHDTVGAVQLFPDSARWTEMLEAELASTAAGYGLSMLGLQDALGRYTTTTGEGAFAEIAGVGRVAADTVRSARTGGIHNLTATTDIQDGCVAQVDAAGNFENADGTGVVLGVNNSGATIAAAAAGDVIREGDAEVTAGAGQDIAWGAKLASSPGGLVVTFVEADHSLMSAVADAATSDWNAGAFAGAETVTVATDVAGDHGITITVYGLDAGGSVVNEAVVLPNPSTGGIATVQTFVSIWYITASAPLGQNLLVDTAAAAAIINAGMLVTGAGPWGAVLTDDSDEAYGHRVQVRAAAGHAGHVILVGTDAAGAAQYEDITLNGTNWVTSTLYWNTVTALWTGEDSVATPTLSIQVATDLDIAFVGFVTETGGIAASATGTAQLRL